MNKKLIYILTSAAALQFVSACKRELNVNDQGRIPANNYYKSSGQAFTGLVAVYDRLGFQSGGLYDKMAIMDVAGGDQYAGGGGPSDINDLQVTENYTLTPLTGPASYLWNRGYSGVKKKVYSRSKDIEGGLLFRPGIFLQEYPAAGRCTAHRQSL